MNGTVTPHIKGIQRSPFDQGLPQMGITHNTHTVPSSGITMTHIFSIFRELGTQGKLVTGCFQYEWKHCDMCSIYHTPYLTPY